MEIPTHKICNKCNEDKSLNEFHNDKRGKYGKNTICKECNNEKTRKYRKDNSEKMKEYDKKLYLKHTDVKIERATQYYKNNLEKCKKNHKKHYEDNIEIYKRQSKQYREEHKEELKKHQKQYYWNNKETLLKNHKEWYENHKEMVLKNSKQYYQDNREIKLNYRKQYREDNLEKCKEQCKQYQKDNREKLLKYQKEYRQTPKGKEVLLKHHSNRRELNYVQLNEYFIGSSAHHVDINHVIYMPEEIHTSFFHCLVGNRAGCGMNEMNKLAFDYLLLNPNNLIVSLDFVMELKDSILN